MLHSWNCEPLESELEKMRLEALEYTAKGVYHKALESFKELSQKADEKYGAQDPRALALQVRLVYLLNLFSENEKAIELGEKISPLVINEFGKNSIEHILVMEAISWCYGNLEDFEKAFCVF
jgi:tetratricopeptide (TPR) repeat protein